MLSQFPESNFEAITQIHPQAPLFTYKSNVGDPHHVKIFTYDHRDNQIVDISRLVAMSLKKKINKTNNIVLAGNINMQQYLIDEFRDLYEKLTKKNFGREYRLYTKNEENLFQKGIDEFLSLKENKLKYASKEKQNNANFVYDCVKDCGCSIQYASNRLKNNKKLAITAILNDFSSLRYVGNKLKDDEEIVLLAVNQHSNSFLWASSRLIQMIGQFNPNPEKVLKAIIFNKELKKNLDEKNNLKKIKI